MAQISQVLARLKLDPVGDLPMADRVDQLCHEHNVIFRDRLLTPLVTLRLLLIQILQGNCSIAALRQLSGIDFAKSSYSDSRTRLPLQLLQSLLLWLHEQAERSAGMARKIGQRILIVDGSTYSIEDTPELHEHFNLPPGTKEGVGYPMGKSQNALEPRISRISRIDLSVKSVKSVVKSYGSCSR